MKNSINAGLKMFARRNWQNIHPISLAVIVTFSFILFSVLIAVLPIATVAQTTIFDIILALSSLLASVMLLQAAKQTNKLSKKIARAWFYFCLALFLCFLGDIAWIIIEVILKIPTIPSIADVIYWFFYIFILIAVLQIPPIKRDPIAHTKRFLDLLIILLGGIIIFWNFVFGQVVLTQSEGSILFQIMKYAYPLADIALYCALMILLYDRISDVNSGPLLLMAFGIAIMIFTDIFSTLQFINESLIIGGVLLVGWTLQVHLFFLAAVVQLVETQNSPHHESSPILLVTGFTDLFSYFPYVWLFGSLIMLINSQYHSYTMSFVQIAVVTLSLLVLVFLRQFVNNIQVNNLIGDIETAQKKIIKQSRDLQQENLYDPLTNLPNRALFMDRLECAMNSFSRHIEDTFVILFLDLDDFKGINDSKGHIIGDSLLREVALRLKDSTRSCDTIARLGGDEFLILLEKTGSEKDVIATTSRILKNVSNKYLVDGLELFVTVSIGIVIGIKDYKNASEILQDADIAMYYAKGSGKSRFAIFNREMRNATVKKILIENELRNAVELGQFRLVYQPIYSLDPEHLIGFEALIRWDNPILGKVMPDEFIPIAEETGLIIKIGEWVLLEACQQMVAWQKLFKPNNLLSINVNISGFQFSQPDFKDKIKNVLKKTGLSPASLKLEITESVLLESKHKESDLFGELKKLGVHLQIDDFGTGYSSLSYLQHIPVDVLKIDRSFICEVGASEKNLELIRAIVNMAEGMGMETTAEGVETKEQKEIILSIGCRYGQGYYWAKPLEQQIVEEFLSLNHPST